MLDDAELKAALQELIKQWNIAEARIKKAEQVRGNEVVASAIFELRYAGRKLVDAIEISSETNLAADKEARAKVRDFLARISHTPEHVRGDRKNTVGAPSL
jgi:hypothetical protein